MGYRAVKHISEWEGNYWKPDLDSLIRLGW